MVEALAETGWALFPAEDAVSRWAHHARAAALDRIATDAAHREAWLDCEGTWFVGVDTLLNDTTGALPEGPPLVGAAYEAARATYGALPLHAGQVSITYPGYPRPRAGESDAALRYRRDRDAAHVDGLHAQGPDRRRHLLERHAYILGLPLSHADRGASPLVVWDGSHHILRRSLTEALSGTAPEDWASVDLTDAYQAARREVFDRCTRVELPASPGMATLVHRLALHGVAPWAEGAEAEETGRMIAYFRPEFEDVTQDSWLTAP
ncbi:hypothetical protein [Roseovarius sp.]|uniref:hypothetical protein n=1 Tax=Roseovarius sp. TaxID=1486281 RepID=UPI0035196CCA